MKGKKKEKTLRMIHDGNGLKMLSAIFPLTQRHFFCLIKTSNNKLDFYACLFHSYESRRLLVRAEGDILWSNLLRKCHCMKRSHLYVIDLWWEGRGDVKGNKIMKNINFLYVDFQCSWIGLCEQFLKLSSKGLMQGCQNTKNWNFFVYNVLLHYWNMI